MPFDGQKYAQMITQAAGGKGVAREVADLILGSRMDLEDAYIKAMLPEFENNRTSSPRSRRSKIHNIFKRNAL